MKWITFQGKEVSTETADHQHLSNCIWFAEVFFGIPLPEVQQAIRDRFNGQILPYRPHVDFEDEIKGLRDRGHLSKFDVNGVAVITYGGKTIGEIRRFPFEREVNLDDVWIVKKDL